MKLFAGAAASALALLVAAPAWAGPGHVGISFGLYAGDDGMYDDTVVAPRLDAVVPVSGGWAVQGILPMTTLNRSGDGTGTVRFGNPYLGGLYQLDLEVFDLSIGAGVGLPVASVPDDMDGGIAAQRAFAAAQGLAGLGEYWLYRPDTFSFAVPLKMSLDLAVFELRADATWALLIATSDASETDTAFQLGAEALFNVPFVGFGVRVQGVLVPTVSGDQAQVSIAPLVEAELGPIYARTMFLINLDGPSGLSFSGGDGKFWGWHFGAGVKW